MQHMGVSAFPSRAAPHAPGCSGGAALMWLQPCHGPPSPPCCARPLAVAQCPASPCLSRGPCVPLCQPLLARAAGMWQRLHTGLGAEGVQGLGAPGGARPPPWCPVPPASLCQMHPSAVRAAQSRLPPLPARFAITAGSRWEMGVAGGAAETAIWARMGTGAPCQDQWGCSKPSWGLSSEAAAEPSEQGTVWGSPSGCRAWGPCGVRCPGLCCGSTPGYPVQGLSLGSFARGLHWGTLPGDLAGGQGLLWLHISATTVPLKFSCPQAVTILGCQQPP